MLPGNRDEAKPPNGALASEAKPTVVLLHGHSRTRRSLASLRRAVEAAGYPTCALTYPSRRYALPELARRVASQLKEVVGDGPIFGVTHSMGGILARHMRDEFDWRGLVMLAPPNRGSAVAAALASRAWGRRWLGPAGCDLADCDGWPDPPSPFAVIAGTRGPSVGNPPSWFISAMRFLPGDTGHDGTVTLAETQLPNMVAYAEVDASHTFLSSHPKTRETVLRFLDEQTS